jgi:DNA-directed RNA polymerase specialized sigma24 family protein
VIGDFVALALLYADLDYDQIAALLGVARGTVAATLHAAHGKLRDVLQEVTR